MYVQFINRNFIDIVLLFRDKNVVLNTFLRLKLNLYFIEIPLIKGLILKIEYFPKYKNFNSKYKIIKFLNSNCMPNLA